MNYLKTTLEDHELVAFVLGNLVYTDFINTTIMKTYNAYKKCALKTFMMRNDLYKVINASLINISIVYFIDNLKFIVELFSQYLTKNTHVATIFTLLHIYIYARIFRNF